MRLKIYLKSSELKSDESQLVSIQWIRDYSLVMTVQKLECILKLVKILVVKLGEVFICVHYYISNLSIPLLCEIYIFSVYKQKNSHRPRAS